MCSKSVKKDRREKMKGEGMAFNLGSDITFHGTQNPWRRPWLKWTSAYNRGHWLSRWSIIAAWDLYLHFNTCEVDKVSQATWSVPEQSDLETLAGTYRNHVNAGWKQDLWLWMEKIDCNCVWPILMYTNDKKKAEVTKLWVDKISQVRMTAAFSCFRNTEDDYGPVCHPKQSAIKPYDDQKKKNTFVALWGCGPSSQRKITFVWRAQK